MATTYLQAVNFGLIRAERVDDDDQPKMVRTQGNEDTVREGIQWYLAMLGSSKIELEPRDDGRFDVGIAAQAKFPATVLERFGGA